jgi:hypothetical protein
MDDIELADRQFQRLKLQLRIAWSWFPDPQVQTRLKNVAIPHLERVSGRPVLAEVATWPVLVPVLGVSSPEWSASEVADAGLVTASKYLTRAARNRPTNQSSDRLNPGGGRIHILKTKECLLSPTRNARLAHVPRNTATPVNPNPRGIAVLFHPDQMLLSVLASPGLCCCLQQL